MYLKVIAVQQALHEPLSDATIAQIRAQRTEFVCLPEHYPLAKEMTNLHQAAARFHERKAYLAELSNTLDAVVVGGTLTEQTRDGYYNTCYLFDRGEQIGFYRKIHPTDREIAAGVLRGNEFKVFEVRGIRIGVLICADVLNTASFTQLAHLGCQVVFIPTASPYREGEIVENKFERDRSIFLAGAKTVGCPIVKTCGVGTTFGQPLQGRSLIATPERIVARALPEEEHSGLLLFAELEIKPLRRKVTRRTRDV